MTPGDDSGAFVRTAERFFRPEFFNRLDRVVPFRRLTRADLAVIARRLVDGVLGRAGFAQRNCVLDVAPEALERVIDAGYRSGAWRRRHEASGRTRTDPPRGGEVGGAGTG